MFQAALRSVAAFSLFIVRKARKTRLFVLVSVLPAIAALIIQGSRLFNPGAVIDGPSVFSVILMAFNLQFLILILSLFYGTSICSDEVEGRTLTYLTTRPLPKSAILLGKYAAAAAVLIAMVTAGVVLAFVVLHFDRLFDDAASWLGLLRGLGVLALGILAYLAFFTFIGTFLKKSILVGLFFSFGWESIVQYFPGTTQRFTIMHYLKSLLPAVSTGRDKLAFLVFRLEPTPPGASVATLLVLAAVFLALAGLVFSRKEYLFDD